MKRTYNVAKADEYGVEIIQMYPPLTKREAREIRVNMKRNFPGINYVVVNTATIIDPEVNWECRK